MGCVNSKNLDDATIITLGGSMNHEVTVQENVMRKVKKLDPKFDHLVSVLNENLHATEKSKDEFSTIMDKLGRKDCNLTILKMNNTLVLSQKDSNWIKLSEALQDNDTLTDIELSNVKMSDNNLMTLLPSLASCKKLIRLSIESNELSGVGVQAVAYMVETHPTLKELHIANQRKSVGVEAERAMANMMSHNTNIIRISHAFIEKFVEVHVNKYIRRNLDIMRQKRMKHNGDVIIVKIDPYPFPHPLVSIEDNIASEKSIVVETAYTLYHPDGASNALQLQLNTTITGNNSPILSGKSPLSHNSSPLTPSSSVVMSAATAASTSTSSARQQTLSTFFTYRKHSPTSSSALSTNSPPVSPTVSPRNSNAIITQSRYKFIKKNDFQLILDRLYVKDETLTDIIFNNTNLLVQKDENFSILGEALRDNPYITSIELANISMTDEHCSHILSTLLTCTNLKKLNMETNYLSTQGIIRIAHMIEIHPSLSEIRLSNQRFALGVEAEKALANALSQNTRILKLSYTCREPHVSNYFNKYLSRNNDIIRLERKVITASKAVLNSSTNTISTADTSHSNNSANTTTTTTTANNSSTGTGTSIDAESTKTALSHLYDKVPYPFPQIENTV